MTPTQLETTARQRYNAVGETFWSQAEMLDLMFAASQEIALEAKIIERTYTTTTVVSQQEYDFPTNTIGIKRITYNGNKLRLINFREDDALTLNNSITTQTGTPQYYTVWNYVIGLRPIPSAAQTLKVYSYNDAQALTISSALEIPSTFHMRIVNFMLSEMYAKDKDFQAAAYYRKMWEQDKITVKQWGQKRKRTDSLTTVMDEESLPETFLGAI